MNRGAHKEARYPVIFNSKSRIKIKPEVTKLHDLSYATQNPN